jgi:uncharacterized Ntn-hydrolase superfamily protein
MQYSSNFKYCSFCVVLVTILLFRVPTHAQDTFSIVAVDSSTQEVASAGASCVDLFQLPGFPADFLGDLIPGKGAINTQSFYDGTNQANARKRILAGDTPQQALQWLVTNDVNGDPSIRQYGIAAIVNGQAQAAAFTGGNCFDFKGHRIGRSRGMHYAIQGNILISDAILDSMEARFIRAQGDLACRVMAAMQGANVPGADERCSIEGVSSKFAFLKMSRPTDRDGSPALSLGLQYQTGVSLEPIDSLQRLLDRNWSSKTSSAEHPVNQQPRFLVYPNPVQDALTVQSPGLQSMPVQILVYDYLGKLVHKSNYEDSGVVIPLTALPEGAYHVHFLSANGLQVERVIKIK